MLRKLFFALVLVLSAFSYGYAQVGSGSLIGTITDATTGESLPFANVVLENKGNQIAAGSADFDGKFNLRPIPPGSYDLLVSYVGYTTKKITGVIISSDQLKKQDVKLQPGVSIGEVEVVAYKVPLIQLDENTTGGTVSSDDIKSMAVRSASDVAKTVGGVYSKDDGGSGLNIRGARESASDVYIDGVKVVGSANLPKGAIGEVSVITGGVPAQYGDVTGGLTIITSKQAIKQTFGSLEYLTSGFRTGENKVTGLDSYGFNLLGFSVGGPMFPKKDEEGKVVSAPVGYLISGEFRNEVDPRGSAVDIYKVKDDVLDGLVSNPLRIQDAILGGGVQNNALYLTDENFETVGFRKNTGLNRVNVSGKLDFNVSETAKITFGGSINYSDQNVEVRNTADAFSLYNWENNPQVINNDIRVFGRFQQSFKNATTKEEAESASLIKNAFFSVQLDYTKSYDRRQNENHKDDLFKYGYVGQFDAVTENSYAYRDLFELQDGSVRSGYFLTAFDSPIAYNYTASDINPILSSYSTNYYNLLGTPTTIDSLVGSGGIVNGRMPNSIYSMWSAPGDVENRYQKNERDQFRVSGYGSANIGIHELLVGFEFEQRIERSYFISPNGLWTLGRNLVNSHILQIDSNNYTVSKLDQFGGADVITFARKYDARSRTAFAYNMRQALGFDVNGTDFINFDSYDISTYKIDYFSAEDLANPANNVNLSYYGFDYKGDKVNNASLSDFFNETDEIGFKKRLIKPYEPIYVAGYIQDKFNFDDLILRVGVRIDRFDANQPVIKDEYSIANTQNAAYARGLGADVPSNITDDAVVYVNDITDPKVNNITGYRIGNTFYNAKGAEISDPQVIYSANGIAPWLQNPGDAGNSEALLNENSFKDYEPQINVMPRVSFSFPISDQATFYANYDILTQRPSSNNQIELFDYLYMGSNSASNRVNNPNLKPEKTINYELGFKQALNKSSAIGFSAFYREQRDMIQVRKITGGYPVDYLTYGNLDFGTVKGATVSYDLRRTKNIKFRASYTIQFANGTGSSTTTSLNLVNSGQPNLRSIFPYSYDQRHQITAAIDYRFSSGKDYNGPQIDGKPILENFGVNLTAVGGSGTPYTARSRAVGSELFSPQRASIVGDVNGSRLPFVFRLDMRIDKDFLVTWRKETENKAAKTSYLNVSLQLLNLLGRSNISDVYAYTGNANDDGYLAASQFQNEITTTVDEQAYRDQYNLKLNNPYNYELPRRIRLGLQLSF